MVRESSEKGVELLLSMPISRAQYFLGKLGGFIAVGILISGAYALVMLVWSAPVSVAAWSISLAFELALMAAVSLFFVLTLTQVVAALGATVGLYFLGRSIAAMQAISTGPLLGDESLVRRLAALGIDAVALILPPLDRATQSSWLVYSAPSAGDLVSVISGLFLYGAFISIAALFDLYRRNL
jgi:ABC-type Na+ efflux pump permease subunit